MDYRRKVRAAAVQASPGRHARPQAPQLAGSARVSVQALLQHVWPDSQAGPPPQPGAWQRPPMHTEPAAQTTPQPPQLRASVCGSTQAPPQVVPVMHSQRPVAQR